jgi:acyl carrier protein
MAVETEVPEDMARARDARLKQAITPEEGVEVFRRVIGAGWPHVIVSAVDLTARKRALQAEKPRAVSATASFETGGRYARPSVAASFVAPRNETERRIAALWEELLGIEAVGVQDNFLELGGHSLLAVQLTSRLRSEFDVEVSLRAFFETPTVAELARLVGQPAAEPTREVAAARQRMEDLLRQVEELPENDTAPASPASTGGKNE